MGAAASSCCLPWTFKAVQPPKPEPPKSEPDAAEVWVREGDVWYTNSPSGYGGTYYDCNSKSYGRWSYQHQKFG